MLVAQMPEDAIWRSGAKTSLLDTATVGLFSSPPSVVSSVLKLIPQSKCHIATWKTVYWRFIRIRYTTDYMCVPRYDHLDYYLHGCPCGYHGDPVSECTWI